MKASGRSANREAAAFFERTLAALEHLPQTPETIQQGIDVRFDLRNALFYLGDVEEGLRYLREAEGLAERLDDRRRLAQASAFLCNSIWMLGDSLEARKLGRRALAIAETLGDFSLTVSAIYYLGQTWITLGDYRQAEDSGREAVRALTGDRVHESFGLGRFPAVVIRGWLAWTLGERGCFEDGIACGAEGVQLGEEIGQSFSLAWACWGFAQLYAVQGNHAEAFRLLERTRAVSSAAGLGVWSTFLDWGRGHLYARSGRVEEGLQLLREALTTRDARGLRNWNSLIAVHLGEACVAAGRLDEARASATRALTLARERGERGHEAYALGLLGEIAAHSDAADLDTAEGFSREAMSLAEELGMRPLIAHCHLGLGKLYHRTDKREQAQEHLATATTMYREMGMTYWLEKAEAEVQELG